MKIADFTYQTVDKFHVTIDLDIALVKSDIVINLSIDHKCDAEDDKYNHISGKCVMPISYDVRDKHYSVLFQEFYLNLINYDNPDIDSNPFISDMIKKTLEIFSWDCLFQLEDCDTYSKITDLLNYYDAKV